MSGVAAIGDDPRLAGFALAGVMVHRATTPTEVEAAWDGLEPPVGLVILAPGAARILETRLDQRPGILTVVLP